MGFLEQAFKDPKIISWHIEDWEPNIKSPEYDSLFSLQKLLRQQEIDNSFVEKITFSREPFSEARRTIAEIYIGLSIKNIYVDMAKRDQLLTYIWALQGNQYLATFEYTFTYLVHQLGVLFNWDMAKGASLEPRRISQFVKKCSRNDYRWINSSIDNQVMSCLALDQTRSGWTLTKIIDHGLNHLKLNTSSVNISLGNFYLRFGQKETEGLILKIIESIYTENKFSVQQLFLNPKNNKTDRSVLDRISTRKKSYNFDTIEGIELIEIPTYKPLRDIVSSPINNIEYILQRKATDHKRNGRMDLAIACLRKSNEIFPYSNFIWSKKDYMRLVEFLKEAGKFEDARNEQTKIDKLFQKDLTALVFEKVLQDCKSLDTDLIESTDNSCVCAECAKYTRRVFSVSGKDKHFQTLPSYFQLSLKEHEYCFNSFHPFCLSSSIPIWEYKGDLIKWCNRPYADERTPEQKAYYRKRVCDSEQEIVDRNNYDLLREKLSDFTPKSLGGFRRMKNLRSSNYLKLCSAALKERINLDKIPDLSIYHFD